eukprot:m.17620 g.17620  ORF g.17620 m.17620 type:complete len:86 (-) comp8322_c0_seq1:305-562(-)
MLGRTLSTLTRPHASSALRGRIRTATTFSHEPVVPSKPNKFSLLSFVGVLAVVPAAVYAGATAAKSLVAYVEDNDIWRPEEDDDD